MPIVAQLITTWERTGIFEGVIYDKYQFCGTFKSSTQRKERLAVMCMMRIISAAKDCGTVS